MALYNILVSANPTPSQNTGLPVAFFDVSVRRSHRLMLLDSDGSVLSEQDHPVAPEERQSIILPVSILNLPTLRWQYIEDMLARLHIEPLFWGVLTEAIIRKASREAHDHNYMHGLHVIADIEITTIEGFYSTRRSASGSTRQRLKESAFTSASDDPNYAGLDESCPICLEGLRSSMELIKTPCNHVFHGECILQWLENGDSCPLCRFQFD